MKKGNTMKRFFLTVLLALLIPTHALAVVWATTWTGTFPLFRSATVGPGNTAYIVVVTTLDDNAISPVLSITHLASFCYDSNDATLPGVSEGAGVIDVLVIAAAGNTDGLQAVSVGSLSAGSPCVHAGPGPVVLQVTTPTDSDGTIVVTGY